MSDSHSIAYPQVQKDTTEYKFSASELKEIKAHIAKYPEKQSAVMPALWIAQRKYGWLSNGAMELVANTLDMSFAHVYGVATFYTMYLKENKAEHLIEICTCFTCGERGGNALYDHANKSLKTNDDGVSSDGKIWLRQAECLGSCDTAPAMQINNGRLRHNVSPEVFDQIVADVKAGKKLEYEKVPLPDQSKISKK